MKLPKLTPNEVTITIKMESQSSDKWSFDDLYYKTIDLGERIEKDLLNTYGINYCVDIYPYSYSKNNHTITVDIDVSRKENVNTAIDNLDHTVAIIYYYLKNIRIPGTKGTRIPLKVTNVSISVDME
jgi:hypothetical protein